MNEVVLNKEKKRFELDVDGTVAVIEYQNIEPNILDLIHTEVPKKLSGLGIGSKLVAGALQYCKSNNLKVVPSCGFIKKYIDKHTEWNELVVVNE